MQEKYKKCGCSCIPCVEAEELKGLMFTSITGLKGERMRGLGDIHVGALVNTHKHKKKKEKQGSLKINVLFLLPPCEGNLHEIF